MIYLSKTTVEHIIYIILISAKQHCEWGSHGNSAGTLREIELPLEFEL